MASIDRLRGVDERLCLLRRALELGRAEQARQHRAAATEIGRALTGQHQAPVKRIADALGAFIEASRAEAALLEMAKHQPANTWIGSSGRRARK